MEHYASKRDVHSRQHLIDVIKNAQFLMPVVVEQADSDQPLVRFRMLYNKYGLGYFMAFTDPMEMAKCADGDQKVLDISYAQLRAMALSDEEHTGGFVIDPKGSNLLITTELIRQFD